MFGYFGNCILLSFLIAMDFAPLNIFLLIDLPKLLLMSLSLAIPIHRGAVNAPIVPRPAVAAIASPVLLETVLKPPLCVCFFLRFFLMSLDLRIVR